MVKTAPQAIVKRASSLSKAAASFRQLITQDALSRSCAQLQSASSTLAVLLNEQSFETLGDDAHVTAELQPVISEIKQAFEALTASYDPPSQQQWRDYIAWNNLIAIYGTLEL